MDAYPQSESLIAERRSAVKIGLILVHSRIHPADSTSSNLPNQRRCMRVHPCKQIWKRFNIKDIDRGDIMGTETQGSD